MSSEDKEDFLKDLSKSIDIKKAKSKKHSKLVNELRRKNYDPFRNVKYFRKRKETPKGVSIALNLALKESYLEEKLAPFMFFSEWPNIVGSQIAKHAKPDTLKNGILFIEVDSSSWAQELIFQKELILKRLQKNTSDDVEIRDLYFNVTNH